MSGGAVGAHGESWARFAIGSLALPLDASESEAVEIARARLIGAGFDPAQLAFDIFKRSVDARRKNDIKIVYSVAVSAFDGKRRFYPHELRRISGQVTPIIDGTPHLTYGSAPMDAPPLVVGMGPAGLFAALMLAEHGYAPILIDRGESVKDRCRTTKIFFDSGKLDPESNIQFGAGGAGTFSDGKLVTRVSDPYVSYVLSELCRFGAPKDITVNAKPHIGTDILVSVVDNMLAHIEALGGKVMYKTKLIDIRERSDAGLCALTSAGEIECSAAVLATGHSARDIYAMVMRRGYAIEAKPFSLGARIEHLQADIDAAMYGSFAGHEKLGRAEYHLSDTTSGRGIYTFCMCPGGTVVAGASEECGVVVNGMSTHARDGKNANSAVLVSVRPEDYGYDPRAAIELQRTLERAAYEAGGGGYYAPMQTLGDFLEGRAVSEPSRILPTYRDGRVRTARLDAILPEYVTKEMKRGLVSFDRRLCGFACRDAVLTGVETRSSAPLRILRTSEYFAPSHDRVYPCGEGAGYAGGISSAAVDGVRVAMSIMARFERKN